MRTLLGRFFVLFLCVQSVFLGGCNSREKPTAETAKINLPRRTSRTLFEERLLGLVRESELLARDVSSKKAAPLEARMRLNELEKAWTEFAAEHPDNIEAQILYGKFLRSARFDEAAYKVFLKVDKKNPNFAVVKQQLSTYEAEQKDFKSSYLHIKEAVSLEPGSAVYLAQLGELLFKAGAYLVKSGEISKESRDVEMQDAFKRASELESESFDFLARYAQSFYDVSSPDWEAALSVWKRAETLAPFGFEKDEARLHVAKISIALGDLDGAKSALREIKAENYLKERASLEALLEKKKSEILNSQNLSE